MRSYINVLTYGSMLSLYLGYYFMMESLFQKTLGKFITVTQSGKLGREGIREGQNLLMVFVPPDPALVHLQHNGLHDKWSCTSVVFR